MIFLQQRDWGFWYIALMEKDDLNLFYSKEEKWLSEEDAIDELLSWNSEIQKHDLRPFYGLLSLPLNHNAVWEYTDFYVIRRVLREELGFDKNSKPGDFDIILIPFNKEKIYFERTAIYEVKIVRPTRNKPGKSPSSLGITQVNGLINDGFPLVGLMHITMTEPLLESEKLPITHYTIPIDIDNPSNNKEVMNSGVEVKMDHFAWISADNQMRRLVSQDGIPKYIGLSCIGLNYKSDGEYSISNCTRNLSDFERGYFNPNKKEDTIEKIKKHFSLNKEKYLVRSI